MSDNNYERLRELIDLHPLGCPPAPEIIEILKILFNKDEARVALGLGFIPFPVADIARRAGVDPIEAESHLETLADKGVVFARAKKGAKGYAMLNIINLFENPYRKGIQDEAIKKLTPLWNKYRAALFPRLGGETTAVPAAAGFSTL